MKTPGIRWIGSTVIAMMAVYLLAYLFSTEVFHGRLGADRFRIRLFHSAAQRRAFVPLLFEEGLASPRDREFSGQTRNHASLPPAE